MYRERALKLSYKYLFRQIYKNFTKLFHQHLAFDNVEKSYILIFTKKMEKSGSFEGPGCEVLTLVRGSTENIFGIPLQFV